MVKLLKELEPFWSHLFLSAIHPHSPFIGLIPHSSDMRIQKVAITEQFSPNTFYFAMSKRDPTYVPLTLMVYHSLSKVS